MKSLSVVSLLLVVGVVAVAAANSEELHDNQLPSYEDPLQTSAEDEIKNLPGLKDAINFRQYSGYLSADDKKKPQKFLHYWFVESQSDPANDPVVLWLNGGPGCSSMGGLFTELGPFSVEDDGETLKLNEFSWNKVANVLFLDSPTGVGFSYSTGLIDFHTDDSTAHMNHLALKSFMQKFPQYKNNSLYLTGESYAGVYLPTLGVLVDADPELNLKGIAIGNGYLDVGKLTDSLVLFSYHHGLLGKTLWDRISQHCCDGKPATRENCIFSGRKSSWTCKGTIAEVALVLSVPGLNPYNLYGKCYEPQATDENSELLTHSTKEIIDRKLMTFGLDLSSSFHNQNKTHLHLFDASQSKLRDEPPCLDDRTLIKYLNKPQVRKAINIPNKVQAWDTCSIIVYVMQYPTRPGGLAPQMKQLISSKRNLTMLVYNGDVDTVCNFLGDEWFVDDLNRPVIKEYMPWKVDKQIAGFVKHYLGITFATVRGSGHMVPGDRPQEALEMFKRFLKAKSSNVFL